MNRDPLGLAAAAIAQREGLATKPCERCFRDGRELKPPKVYAVRELLTDECHVVYECETCGWAAVYPIPQHLLLAVDVRGPEAAELAAESTPALFYSANGDEIDLWLDPADGLPPIRVGHGDPRRGSAGRAKAAIDYLSGGNGSRAAPVPIDA